MKTISFAAIVAVSIAAPVLAEDRADWPESFTVGTASQGGTYFAYGSGWANLVADELGLTGGGEVTGGQGTNPIAPGLQMTNACAMFPMYQTPFAVTTLTSSGIASISDIPAGAKIGFGPAGSTSDTYFPRMMETLGVDFERRNGGWNDLGTQLQDGLLDVIAFAAGVPTPAVSQLEVQTDVNFITFTADEQATILESFPVAPFTIPSDTYESMSEDAQSVSMWNFAIANCDLPASFVEAVVDVVMSDNERMVSIHKAARSTLPENWDKNGTLMWHPGAAKWFTENAGAEIAADMIFGG